MSKIANYPSRPSEVPLDNANYALALRQLSGVLTVSSNDGKGVAAGPISLAVKKKSAAVTSMSKFGKRVRGDDISPPPGEGAGIVLPWIGQPGPIQQHQIGVMSDLKASYALGKWRSRGAVLSGHSQHLLGPRRWCAVTWWPMQPLQERQQQRCQSIHRQH